MKILQTIASFGAKSGGTSTCTYDLVTALNQIDCPTDLLTLKPTDPTDRLMGTGESWIKALEQDGKTPFGYSHNIAHYLDTTNYDLYHTNGLWMYCNHITTSVARKKGKRYIITPHGMLYPQALARSSWKKNLLMYLYFDKDIRKADCIHVTCMQEMIYYRDLGYKNPVAVIANPAPIPDYIDEIKPQREKRRIGFLGRLHPRKHVKGLIEAWASLGKETQNAELFIMGKGDDVYEAYLRELVTTLGLTNVIFAGFVSGRDKFDKLATLTALFVPSDFENFGMIITESLIVKTPVMASLGTPWEELTSHHCGWWVNNDIQTLAQTIDKALSLSEEEREAMGERGKQLVLEKFSDMQVATQMKQLYEWILYGGTKPEFVYEQSLLSTKKGQG